MNNFFRKYDSYIIIGIILITSFFDALRDVYWCSDKDWIFRHVFKWIAFYLPLAYLFFKLNYKFAYKIVLLPAAWLVWQIGLCITGAEWESIWIKLIKKILELFK